MTKSKEKAAIISFCMGSTKWRFAEQRTYTRVQISYISMDFIRSNHRHIKVRHYNTILWTNMRGTKVGILN